MGLYYTGLTWVKPNYVVSDPGNVEIVSLLISSGAQLEAFDVHFGPPLHIASAKGHTDCVRELLQAGEQKDGEKKTQGVGFELWALL